MTAYGSAAGRWLLSAMLFLAPPRAAGEGPTVAAAADLQPVLPAIVERFARETGHRAVLTFGSSGHFFSQIQHGAPFDLFLSADVEYPTRLEAEGLAEPGTLTRYAGGRLVLWSRRQAALDVRRGLSVVRDSLVRRVAVANPAHAPYGRAAVAALKKASLYDQVRGKLVFGDHVSQAAQFVQSGNADVGIIPLSLALAPALAAEGRWVELPASTYPPLHQAGVILRSARHKDAARQLLAFLRRPDSTRLLRAAGFSAP